MPANDKQVGGSHYKGMKIEPWDYTLVNEIPHGPAVIIEYLSRYRLKGGIADLKKARHWLDKVIEIEEAKERELKREQKRKPTARAATTQRRTGL